MTVKRFDRATDCGIWDDFLKQSKNQTFLFQRGFMDYHMDRIKDYSLLVQDEKNKLVALLPANTANGNNAMVVSHEGLTYGGLVVHKDVKVKTVLSYFYHILSFLAGNGIKQLRLKQLPAFFNESPTDEVEYALFLLEAELYRRDVAMVIDQNHRISYTGNIRREGAKAEKAGARVKESGDMQIFWEQVLVPNLQARYGVQPVHSLQEINLLKQRFPNQIRQFDVFIENEIVAGTTLFVCPNVVHCQYISASDYGRKSGALNHLFKYLIDDVFQDYRFFDFGIVNENGGRSINDGMLFWKESFGGRAHRHDFYNIQTSNHKTLEPYILN